VTIQETSQAITYGAALGDALGWPIEFLPMRKIKAIYGPNGIQEPPDPALFTDDTQMTLALNEALVEAGEADIEALMEATVRRFVAWKNAPETDARKPGYTVVESVRLLEAGTHWRESGTATKGCGSAMRVSGVGFLYQTDPDRLREVAHHSGVITHSHATADAGTIAAAYLVKLALDGVAPDDYLRRVATFVNGISEEVDVALLRVGHVLGWTDEEAAINHIGKGWTADEAVALSVYCVVRYPDDYPAAVRRAANIPGDSDSVACITGGIMGARLGLESIPQDWITRLEKHDYLTDVANRLAAKQRTMYGDS
jgi:ADP-ribosylglycohydrolase